METCGESGQEALVLFAKVPVPGKVKTRLFPCLSPEEASRLYQAFVWDAVAKAAQLRDRRGVVVSIAAYPSSNDPFFHQLRQEYGLELSDQEGDDLGERMGCAVKGLLARGSERVVLIGSDSPTLPTRFLDLAFDLLGSSPVVLGPSFDGGYYLVGLSRWIPEIFEDIPWSTGVVLERTLQKIRELGLGCEILPAWHDVDDPEGLRLLIAQMAQDPQDTEIARNTRKFLRDHPVRRLAQSAEAEGLN